jgi:hypothetical protein
MVSCLHDGRVPSGLLLGATHQNGCPQNDAVTRESLFTKELLRRDAKRELSARSEVTTGNTVYLGMFALLALFYSLLTICQYVWFGLMQQSLKTASLDDQASETHQQRT